MLELVDVSKQYGKATALQEIRFEIRPNEIFALLGPTGAGKTSTLLCTAGLEQVSTGRIILDARDITRLHPMSRDIAMVFEGYNLLSLLNVRDNIAFPLRSPRYRETESVIGERVQRVADDLHIAHLLDRNVDTLSGGERQRVAIARAMVRHPRLYLLDEPLSALDLKLREELRLELRQLHQRHASTILYATHDYHGAAAIADRIGVIEQGRLYQTGTLHELFDNPRHMRVGALLGSPAMAFFPGEHDGSRLMPEGFDRPLDLASLPDANTGRVPERVTLGVWPEVIDLQLAPAADHQRGTIYATDFRGIDRVVQVQFGARHFRKVVDIDFPAAQGDDCWFRFLPEHAFLFDGGSGERLDHAGN